jgi:hypothetical protein
MMKQQKEDLTQSHEGHVKPPRELSAPSSTECSVFFWRFAPHPFIFVALRVPRGLVVNFFYLPAIVGRS